MGPTKTTLERCEKVLMNVKNIEAMCELIGKGYPLTKVAEHFNMSPMSMVNKLHAAETLTFSRKRGNTALEIWEDDYLTPEERLYKDVFRCDIDELAELMPEDAAKTIDYVVSRMLSEREHDILEMRYKGEMTYEDIANCCYVTRERVRQIHAKAVRKLRHPERANALRGGYLEAMVAAARLETAKNDRIRALLAGQVERDPDVLELVRAERGQEQKQEQEQAKPLTIDELGLSVRSYNCLRRNGVKTLDDVCGLSEIEFYKIRNLGRKSVEDVIACVHNAGRKMQWEE